MRSQLCPITLHPVLSAASLRHHGGMGAPIPNYWAKPSLISPAQSQPKVINERIEKTLPQSPEARGRLLGGLGYPFAMSRDRRERTTPLMMGIVLNEQDPFEVTTKRFLLEDKEHEERAWNDVLPLDDEREPNGRRGRSGRIDKVPRRWSAVIAFVALCICVILGATVGGFALFAKGNFRSWFKTTTSHDETAARSLPKQSSTEARMEPQLTAPTSPQPEARPRAPVPAEGTAAAPKPSNSVVQPDLEGAERLRQDAIAVRKRLQQRHSEDDLVWSQELKALVHASSLGQPAAQPIAVPGNQGATSADPPGR